VRVELERGGEAVATSLPLTDTARTLANRGCTTAAIRDAVKLTFTDLVPDGPTAVAGILRVKPHHGPVGLLAVNPNITYLAAAPGLPRTVSFAVDVPVRFTIGLRDAR